MLGDNLPLQSSLQTAIKHFTPFSSVGQLYLEENGINVLDAISTHGGIVNGRATPVIFGSARHTSTHGWLCIMREITG